MRVIIAMLVALALPASAFAQERPAVTEAQKEEARSHFQLGLSHFDREEWAPALVEFLKSRELFPSRGNTLNAAICLRKVGRYDEALDMYETLLRDFHDMLSPTDRALAEREVVELQASVGMLTLEGSPDGASVTVDGIDRGLTPLKPLRLSAGTHSIRVTKDGALPFEGRFDLVGKQAVTVRPRLAALTQAGRLRVTERAGKALDLFIDGSLAGRTPWEGALAPGVHTVWLRGAEGIGTPPVTTTVKLDALDALDLASETLGATLRIDAKPASAALTIDGVPVGHGSWSGGLRPGTHALGATLDGYAPASRTVNVTDGAAGSVTLVLEPMVALLGRSGIAIELDVAATLGLVDTSDLLNACSGACGASLPAGAEAVVHAVYELKSGLALGIHAGYLLLGTSMDDRATQTQSGTLVAHGTAHDGVLLHGLLAGVDAQYHTRGDWPLTVRLGLGVLVGAVHDHRTGSFAAARDGTPFAVDTTQSPLATYLDFAPEVRIGRRFGKHFQVNAGVALHVLASLAAVPRWNALTPVPTGHDGEGTFPNESLAGSIVLTLVPGVGAEYAF